MIRCDWCGTEPIYVAYHDEEWGVPERDARALYEKIVMDGFQAGLSWITILRRREGIRDAFEGFDPERIARYGARDKKRLLADPRIIRNRQKVDAAIKNAQAFLEIEDFSELLWSFTGGATKQNAWKKRAQIPAETKESIAMSKELKKRGMAFVGPTICYAFMQAVGMVNDHVVDCHRYGPLSSSAGAAPRRSGHLSSSPAFGGGGAPKGRRGRA